MKEFGIMISAGRWGGFYYAGGWSKRLCLGWIAFTFFPTDGDNIITLAARSDKVTILLEALKTISEYNHPSNEPAKIAKEVLKGSERWS